MELLRDGVHVGDDARHVGRGAEGADDEGVRLVGVELPPQRGAVDPAGRRVLGDLDHRGVGEQGGSG